MSEKGQKHSRCVRPSLGESGGRRRVACLLIARGRWDGGGGMDVAEVDASVTEGKPPKGALRPRDRVPPRSSNSSTLSRPAIYPCANSRPVNIRPGQMDAMSSMRKSSMMDRSFIW